MERLHKSCRRLIWLNPLLRFDGYAPLATGARAIIRHVDDFRPVHNLESLAELTAALGRIGPRREEALTSWQGMAKRECVPAARLSASSLQNVDGTSEFDDQRPRRLQLRLILRRTHSGSGSGDPPIRKIVRDGGICSHGQAALAASRMLLTGANLLRPSQEPSRRRRWSGPWTSSAPEASADARDRSPVQTAVMVRRSVVTNRSTSKPGSVMHRSA